MNYRGKDHMNPDKKMTGVPLSVTVSSPGANRTQGMSSPGSISGSGNPMSTIKSNSKGKGGGTTC